MVLATMEETDLDEVLKIEQASFTEPWSRKMFVGELRGNAFSTNLIARAQCGHFVPEGTLLGYVIFWVVFDELHVMNLAVRSDLRRRGIAGDLVREAVERGASRGVRTALLEVRASNSAALALYAGFGFQRRGIRRGYYDHPREDAVIMVLEKGGHTMLSEDPAILDQVRRESSEFKKMEETHRHLEDQLAQLSKLHILTPEEEIRKKQMQFDKLAAKDKMAEIVRQYKQHRTISA